MQWLIFYIIALHRATSQARISTETNKHLLFHFLMPIENRYDVTKVIQIAYKSIYTNLVFRSKYFIKSFQLHLVLKTWNKLVIVNKLMAQDL